MALNPGSLTTPIRTVFNSSQVYKGYSLNSSWELGPEMTGSLHGILLRFREDLVAAQGDVKKMYYQVRITPEEQMMQLYIWKFTGEDKIRVFAMTRLVMGNKPSANCAQIALRETAFIEEEPPAAAVTALTEDSYVDNTFTVAPDNVTIDKNIKEIESTAAKGGFQYKPWIISGQDVPNQSVPSSGENHEKALGVCWNVKEDTIFIQLNDIDKKKAKKVDLGSLIHSPDLKLNLRTVLSFHSKAYDPKGLVLPTKMIGSLLFRTTLQHLSKQKVNVKTEPKNKLP